MSGLRCHGDMICQFNLLDLSKTFSIFSKAPIKIKYEIRLHNPVSKNEWSWSKHNHGCPVKNAAWVNGGSSDLSILGNVVILDCNRNSYSYFLDTVLLRQASCVYVAVCQHVWSSVTS
jgi:hypothetical protein